MKTLLKAVVCICLAAAGAALGQSTPKTAAPATGTVKVATPGVTLNIYAVNASVTSRHTAEVPAGVYQAAVTCTREVVKDGTKEKYSISAGGLTGRPLKITVAAGEVTMVQAGPPLVAKVTLSPVRQRAPASDDNKLGRYVDIDLAVTGQGGEGYRVFRKDGKDVAPTFTIFDGTGKQIGEVRSGLG